ncbi:MAG: cell division protein FtsZ [Flavobacteriales bacterium]|nr:cell division protein FtsZ [Flavobacteriales bacterium]MBT6233609.1 cell division protein FtsZ [Flavobacteriales bacterium]
MDDLTFDMPKSRSSIIKVIGVGGGGSNAVNHMKRQGIHGVDFIVCNTDAQALSHSPVENKIQLGASLTEGLGAGANPEVGERAALESYEVIQHMLESNTKMVFITAGMGGGTGTGAAPIIAQAAKEMGILTVGIVTAPFGFEGNLRLKQAETGIESLKKQVDSLIVINNDKLREIYGNLGYKSGFSKADGVLATAAKGIAEVITNHYNMNIDLNDARKVLEDSGTAIMGSAVARGENRAQQAVQEALDSPLLNDNHILGAKHVLLLIVSGTNEHEITFDEIGEINDYIQSQAGNQVDIIMGMGEDISLDDGVQVTIIATGFSANNPVGDIRPAEPERIVRHLDELKVPEVTEIKAPEDETASTQFDLFSISDQPLPDSPKEAGKALFQQQLDASEKPIDAVKGNIDSQVVHSLDEEPVAISSPEVVDAIPEAANDITASETAHVDSPSIDISMEDDRGFVLSEISMDDEDLAASQASTLAINLPIDLPIDIAIDDLEAPLLSIDLDEDLLSFDAEPASEKIDSITNEEAITNDDLLTIDDSTIDSTDEIDASSEAVEMGDASSSQWDLEDMIDHVTSNVDDISEQAIDAEKPTFNLEDLKIMEQHLKDIPMDAPLEATVEEVALTEAEEPVQSMDDAADVPIEAVEEVLEVEPEEALVNEQAAVSDIEQTIHGKEEALTLTVMAERPSSSSALGIDAPHSTSIQEMQKQRKAYLANFTHKFHKNSERMALGDDDEPAFERQGLSVNTHTTYSQRNATGNVGLSSDGDDIEFRSHNSFLHDNVD